VSRPRVATAPNRINTVDTEDDEAGRMLDPYLPLVLMFALAGAFALFSVTAAPYIGPRRYNRAKLDAY
jgi:hypothetical protein